MGVAVLFISLASMGGIGLVLALILVIADKKLAVKEDPRVEQALEVLPGINCGACGFAGCSAFAAAVAEEKVSVSGCKPGGAEVADRLAKILGVAEAEAETPKKARVFCSGGLKEAVRDKVYHGVMTCESAHIIGGEKACLYSCIGFGDCVTACPFDAIEMGGNGLPVIDLVKCTGCGECVRACPRNIIGLTDADERIHVYCRSHDKGPVVRKICSAGCVACKLCEKDDDTGSVKIIDNLSVIDYSVHKAPLKAIERCPTKVIRESEPVPGFDAKLQSVEREAEAARE
jgi:RnfABCDGE-type electron transport complex B subunit